jgi:large subunit ribosomal protein L25
VLALFLPMPPSVASVVRASAQVQAFRVRSLKALNSLPSTVVSKQSAQSLASPVLPTIPNPFLPSKNAETGRWHAPQYSLRRQKELVKAARTVGALDLLPPGLKCRDTGAQLLRSAPQDTRTSGPDVSTDASGASTSATVAEVAQPQAHPQRDLTGAPWALPVTWEGAPELPKAVQLAAARLYAGKRRMFKGHKWERVRAQISAHRRNLMRDMEKRVNRYKNVREIKRVCPGRILKLLSVSTTLAASRTLSRPCRLLKPPNYLSSIPWYHLFRTRLIMSSSYYIVPRDI